MWWDYDEHRPKIPWIHGGSPAQLSAPSKKIPREKNWSPLVIVSSDLKSFGMTKTLLDVLQEDELLMVYTIDPLRILSCNFTNGNCSFIFNEVERITAIT